MENKEIKRIKKSVLNAKGRFDYEKLVYGRNNLIPCTYEEELEEILFTYDMTGLKPVLELKQEEKRDQYQFLINFQAIEALQKNWWVSLATDNIYYDENFLPYVKHRDLYAKGEMYQADEFLFLYKTFIGGFFCSNYTVEILQESGLELLDQEVVFKEFYEARDSAALVELLKTRKAAYLKTEEESIIKVPKINYKWKTIVSIVSSILLVLCVGTVIYLAFWKVPSQARLIAAHAGYIEKDYIACIDSMEGVDPAVMDIPTKYILALSYARSESLKKEEIDGIISKLSLNSNEKELEYWIYLGRMNAQKAGDLAMALSDDKLLIYAYMKELSLLESDTTMEGEEKAARISQLEQSIKSLGEKYTEEKEKTVEKGSKRKGEKKEGTKPKDKIKE